MKRSLRRHLSLTLGSAIVLAGLAAALASFGLAYFEAKEFQDDMLRQIAMLHVNGPSTFRVLESPHRDTGEIPISDPESRIIVIHLPRDARPDWIHLPRDAKSTWVASDLPPGLHTLNTRSGSLRVLVRDMPAGERLIVAQLTTVRDELALSSALQTLIPLLLLLPLLVWLIVRIVHSELAPITRMAKALDAQPADRPQAVPDNGLPDEITPFVHAINRLLERVNLLIGQQRRFIADAAHELRSPLTALSLQAQNLMRAESLDAVRERVVPLQEGIERARHLAEQLLSLARTQASIAEASVVDVSAMVRELMAEYWRLAEAKRIDLGLEETAPFTLRGSRETLRLMISNALENALKYTPEGGEVTLRLRSDAQGDLIEIVDNGPGIPPAERERVFDAFYRIPGAKGEGSGLGLAIAHEAAIRMGGTVNLYNRQAGSGLIFRYQHGCKN
ncbi:MAG: two-component sensor histidine kinase [Candidatus Competibacteraceae bacterium]|nr:two-component sensor histidine kinase [Candidatus Competibacteraceae bacterium]MCP5124253.1 two-component sensor histidine kinase [Gammaproteobacteria bacterium]HRX71922.1 ATP-binding protein [Candidatus Competibacteraceae bacterium]